ncbi:uncharacterized protein [Lolium perenne]|uniref:uncharacterized protein n=1 Tax=Lolium perenne TaxID=4522 RepID=UPI0021F52116|nr:uncharacterized protein LOC127346576 [Lolium perenne]
MSTTDADRKIKFMTYNVWSNEHVAVYRRMQAVSDLIARHDPDVILLQEVTPYMKDILRKSPWWRQYYEKCHAPDCFAILLTKFTTGQLGDIIPDVAWLRPLSLPKGLLSVFLYWKCRRLTETAVDAGVEGRLHPMYCDHKLIVSTCLFPGPSQSGIHSKDRLDKADQYLEYIDRRADPNAVLGGDMNWDDDLDGPFPIEGRKGWVDAWCELRGDNGSAGGLTYDSVANPMLRSFKSGRTRPDRFICKLRDFNLDSIEMIGTEAIPGVTYYDDKGNQLPVLPSHHFGLMLTVSPKHD